MAQINVQQICSITRRDKAINDSFRYIEAYTTKSWFRTKMYEGRFIRNGVFDHSDITVEEILRNNSDCYMEDNKIYYYPYLFFRMSNGGSFTKNFKTVEALEEFLNQEVLTQIKVIE